MNVYLDHAATTPLDEDVLDAMTPYFGAVFGNASSLHGWGQRALHAVDRARLQVAEVIHCRPEEVYFTSGGTESDNWALKGVLAGRPGARVIVSAVEHPAVLRAAEQLAECGHPVTYRPVSAEGVVDTARLASALTDDVALVSVMAVNNEVGTIQPIREVAELCHAHGALVHTDAVQALGAMPVDVQDWGVDLLSLSAHKFYGPKGVGALYVRRGVSIRPLLAGGRQERDKRGGTYNTPGIVGLAAALVKTAERMPRDAAHIRALSARLTQGLTALGAHLAVPEDKRIPAIVGVWFDRVDGDALLARMDLEGVAVGRGSACSAGTGEPSHVLTAMGASEDAIKGTIRLSLGRANSFADVEDTLALLRRILPSVRG